MLRYRNSKIFKFLTKKLGKNLQNLRKFTKIYKSLQKFTQITKVYSGYVILRKFTPKKNFLMKFWNSFSLLRELIIIILHLLSCKTYYALFAMKNNGAARNYFRNPKL